MLGWEFPPNISGGLGVASKSLSESLAGSGHDVTFLLPKKNKEQISEEVTLIDASSITPDTDFWKEDAHFIDTLSETSIGSLLMPYLAPEVFVNTTAEEQKRLIPTEDSELLDRIELTGNYESDLSAELLKYAMLAVQVALQVDPTIIHAHDWITFRAALLVKKTLDLPIVLHTHSIEFDRNGIHAQQHIMDEEQAGFEAADQIIAVSQKLKQTIMDSYGIANEKIHVVPNILEMKFTPPQQRKPQHIAFIGRLTHQKSPSMFVDMARDLCSRGYDYHFSIIGDGHLRADLESKAASSNFAGRLRFEGFLDRSEVMKRLSMIDLLVVPSVSEPFGLVALEAILHGIPVAATRGIGLGEFIPSIPQVERWDHYSYVRLMERLMKDATYRSETIAACQEEAKQLTKEKSTSLIEAVYNELL